MKAKKTNRMQWKLVWKFSSCHCSLWATTSPTLKFRLETPQKDEIINLKESVYWYSFLNEWEQEGEDYGPHYKWWLHEICRAIPGRFKRPKLWAES